MNAAISAAGTTLAGATSRPEGREESAPADLRTGVFLQEVKSRVSAIVDPFLRADVSLTGDSEAIGFEEAFVNAVLVGLWTPAPGSGKHTHLGSGGLANSVGGGIEAGWDQSWSTATNLPTAKLTWDGSSYLGCTAIGQTWKANSGQNETKPINCVNWYHSAAFCIWDGGFLPSEAEWNYAAVSDNLQRQYPWSDPAGTTTIDCSYANYFGASGGNTFCVQAGTSVVGAVSPKGNSLYSQVDLAGNVFEWNLD